MHASHEWITHYGEAICKRCDCRPLGRWASLPCGTDEIPESHDEPEHLTRLPDAELGWYDKLW